MNATPFVAVADALDEIKFDANGLVTAIAQEDGSGDVLMLAWMSKESLQLTLETGRMWYWSRSRQELWCKGETSGNRQFVRKALYDCDADALLFVVEQEGGAACHTGDHTCFHRELAARAARTRNAAEGSDEGAPPERSERVQERKSRGTPA